MECFRLYLRGGRFLFFFGGGVVAFRFSLASSELLRYVRTFGTLLGNIHANEKNKPVTLESKD